MIVVKLTDNLCKWIQRISVCVLCTICNHPHCSMDDKSCSEVKFHKPISSIGNLVPGRAHPCRARRASGRNYTTLQRDFHPPRRLDLCYLCVATYAKMAAAKGFARETKEIRMKPKHPLQSGQPEALVKGRGKMPIGPRQKRQWTLYKSECTV